MIAAAAGRYRQLAKMMYPDTGFGWTATRFALAAMLVELTTP